jgi:hypothetical protein
LTIAPTRVGQSQLEISYWRWSEGQRWMRIVSSGRVRGFGWVHVNFLVSLSKTKNVRLRTVVGLAATDCDVSWHSSRTDYIPRINARIVAVGIPGASAISQSAPFSSTSAKAPARPHSQIVSFLHPVRRNAGNWNA